MVMTQLALFGHNFSPTGKHWHVSLGTGIIYNGKLPVCDTAQFSVAAEKRDTVAVVKKINRTRKTSSINGRGNMKSISPFLGDDTQQGVHRQDAIHLQHVVHFELLPLLVDL